MEDDRPVVTFGPALRFAGHLMLVSLCVVTLVPMLLVVGTAFKPASEIYSISPWPVQPTLENFARIFQGPFGIYLWNSFGTTVLRVTGQIVIAILAAYAFARWEFRGRDLLFACVLGSLMVPHTLTMIPIYLMIAELGWFDTWTALIVPNLAFPFGVFLLRQHMLSFPKELIEAAAVDGAGPFKVLWSIILPNLSPAIAGLVIVAVIETWNEYFWPLLVTDSDRMRTVQLGIRRFLESDGGESFGPLMAGVTTASLPVLILFFILQRRVMQTFVSSGIK
jgi:multiple sugar transport system permease protein/sn-glycerol 3-phosphate transport system permease protein